LYHPDAYVEGFEALREALGAACWFICGQSLGGALTLRYSLTHPERLMAQIFTNSNAGLADADWIAARRASALQQAEAIEQNGRDALEDLPVHPNNPADSLAGQLANSVLFGVDVTDFLDHALVRSPVTLYLFHVIRSLLDGRRLVCWMDEFWRLLADPGFESFAKDGPKTWRKLNAVMALATQSASDVLDSPISRTIIEQTPTKILFPNPDASEAEYVDGFGLSEREFKLIKEQLEPGSRQFLVKQGHYSVVCQLDLKGFDAELKVISGRASSVEALQMLMAKVGIEPEHWLTEFLAS
jgi:hypothetical protein